MQHITYLCIRVNKSKLNSIWLFPLHDPCTSQCPVSGCKCPCPWDTIFGVSLQHSYKWQLPEHFWYTDNLWHWKHTLTTSDEVSHIICNILRSFFCWLRKETLGDVCQLICWLSFVTFVWINTYMALVLLHKLYSRLWPSHQWEE